MCVCVCLFCVCDGRSSVSPLRTAPHRLCLPRASPRGSGSPSPSPSGRLAFFHLLVTSTLSTQRVIISLLWPGCHLHPHHYPVLSVLNEQEIIRIIITFGRARDGVFCLLFVIVAVPNVLKKGGVNRRIAAVFLYYLHIPKTVESLPPHG